MIKPLPGYVLVSPIKDDLKEGGVYLPQSSEDKPMKGKVVNKGECDFVEKHYIVVYKKWTNQEVKHKGKEYLLVKFDELLAVIE